MIGVLITLLTFVLIMISVFMVVVILMQRANTNAGMGAAFGGGVAESAFGAETTNVLVKATRWSAAGFFIVATALYLLYIGRYRAATEAPEELPVFEVPEPAAEAAPAFPVVPAPEGTLSTETEGSPVSEPAAEAAPLTAPEPLSPAPEPEPAVAP